MTILYILYRCEQLLSTTSFDSYCTIKYDIRQIQATLRTIMREVMQFCRDVCFVGKYIKGSIICLTTSVYIPEGTLYCIQFYVLCYE
jgi:hypothetical protein